MKIITNTAMSLDGKIGIEPKQHHFLGSEYDRNRMSLIRSNVDAILVGGQTFRNWPQPLLPLEKDEQRDYVSKPLLNVILSHSMQLPISNEYKLENKIKSLVLTDIESPAVNFPLEQIVSLVPITPQWIIEELSLRGIKTLLIEGGGELIFSFLKAKLIHEMYITLCPKIIGGRNRPSIVTGSGFTADKLINMTLLKAEPINDEIFLHYSVKN
ncbi:hypothetical protein BVY03_04135 [bacterium K02(2017)]|nr:hypothetical protein BVY03_04135 [bacterium K02(2017)]